MSLPLNAFQAVRPRGVDMPSALPPTVRHQPPGGGVPVVLPGSQHSRKPAVMRRPKTQGATA